MSCSFSVSHWLSDSSLTHSNHCITRRSTGNKTNFHTHFQLPPSICHFLSILYFVYLKWEHCNIPICCIPDALPEDRVMFLLHHAHQHPHKGDYQYLWVFFKQNFINSEEIWISLVWKQLVKRGKLTSGRGFAWFLRVMWHMEHLADNPHCHAAGSYSSLDTPTPNLHRKPTGGKAQVKVKSRAPEAWSSVTALGWGGDPHHWYPSTGKALQHHSLSLQHI